MALILKQQGIIRKEIRFKPQFHKKKERKEIRGKWGA
jgi:hypothetical protein